ncbi:glucose 1-dehydrogenase [bacterium A37T11]|nr:glucose 1-dehydrogenase [bacterium A37T11]
MSITHPHRKIALVTGASSGIGKAIALALAERGYTVAIHYHKNEADAKAVLEQVEQKKGTGSIFQADLAEHQSILVMVSKIWDTIGPVELLINNAGVSYKKPFLEQTPADIRFFTEINFYGTCYLTQEIAKKMVGEGIQGSIYSITSVNAIRPGLGHSIYGATKGALETLMKGVAFELAPYGIRVNTIVVGAVQTDINESVWHDQEKKQQVESHIPMGRMGLPEDVAAVIAQLAGHDQYMTGTSITIDGGWLVKTGFESPKKA